MEIKKNPKANLENYAKLFMQLGIVLALFVVHVLIEYKTYDRVIKDLGYVTLQAEEEEDVPITRRVEPVKPPPPLPEKIELIEDEKEIEETIIEPLDTDVEEIVELEDIEEVFEEEDVVEDVSFAMIDVVPVYPGCRGSNMEKKSCFVRSIRAHVSRKFNINMVTELGLTAGKKTIFVEFVINKKGKVVDVRAKAPHRRLKKEAARVIRLLPKMIPGKQDGRPVGVKYSLPITFNVE